MSHLISTVSIQPALLLFGERGQAQVLSRQKPHAQQCLALQLSDLPHVVAPQSHLRGRAAGHPVFPRPWDS